MFVVFLLSEAKIDFWLPLTLFISLSLFLSITDPRRFYREVTVRVSHPSVETEGEAFPCSSLIFPQLLINQ